ncbi:MAG: tryptophan synthase subunit beta [Myxococcota bacterium]|nr:tryptophan synthase subunit beta [Myxococcota bacterium]
MFEPIAGRPDKTGRFGDFGGRFVPEVLMPALLELERAYDAVSADPSFEVEYRKLLNTIVGRPSLLTHAKRLSSELGAEIFLKREDLNHTGAHKINQTLGQALLCRKMGKKRVIAETGAGQHGVATAAACAIFGFECVVYMGSEDIRRQGLNVLRMQLFGAEVRAVTSGTKTLKDAMNEAMRDWVANVDDTYYLVGSAAGPHPYPVMVRNLQSVIGEEARRQMLEQGGLPNMVTACVGGGSNAIGLFHAFVGDESVRLIGAEAAGDGLDTGRHSASLNCGTLGVLHGARTQVLQSEDGQISPPHSIAAGLDYPAVGPEHCFLQATGRASYEGVDDREAVEALQVLAKAEGIICALETAHAVAMAMRYAKGHQGARILVGLSGRGDKDMTELARFLGESAS